MTDEACPACGSEDYGPVNEGHEHCCLTCGYDTEHGDAGTCPGGPHPKDGNGPACPACLARLPRDLSGWPRWRSYRRRALASARRKDYPYAARLVASLDEAVVEAVRNL